MAERDQTKAAGDGAPKAAKRREELDQLLKRIAAHMSDAERAEATAGSAVPASGAPDPAPAAGGAVTPRGSLRLDAARNQPAAAAPDTAASAAGPQPDTTEPASPSAPEDEAKTPAALPPTTSVSARRSPPTVEPPALRSALATTTARTQRTPASTAAPAAVAPLQPAGEAPPSAGPAAPAEAQPASPAARATASPAAATDGEGHWDPATAEALTKAYEVDAALPPLRSMLGVMSLPPGGAEGPAADDRRHEARSTEAEAEAAGDDLAEARLIAAARRVEAMLDRLAPRTLVQELGERVAAVEGEVGRTGAALERLDAKLSDEHVVRLFGALVPTAEDLVQFADEAASRAAERALEAHSRNLAAEPAGHARPAGDGGNGPQIKALSELLATFMDERRRTDAGTLDALETLQLAMQHMLDRLDQVDTGARAEPAAPAMAPASPVAMTMGAHHAPTLDYAPGNLQPPATAPARERLSQPPLEAELQATPPSAPAPVPPPLSHAPAQPRAATAPAPSDPHRSANDRHPALSEPRDLDIIPDAPGYTEMAPPARWRDARADADNASAAAAGGHEVATPPAELPGRAPHRASLEAAPQPTGRASPAEPPPAPLSDRQAFIAMARKAAEKAKSQAPAAEPAARGDKSAGVRGQVLGAIGAKAPAGIRPGVLVVASLAAFLLAGYWFLAGPRLGMPRATEPVVIEQTGPAQGGARDGSQPDIEPDRGAGDTQGRQAPAPAVPRRTSSDGNHDADAPRLDEARMLAPVDAASGPGMAIALADSPASAEAIVQARERARLASLSQRAAFSAARMHAAPPGTSAIETAAIPAAPEQPAPAARQPSQPLAPVPAEAPRQLELPSAATGPLSLRVAAAKGDPAAQLEIATRLAEGRGVKQSFAEAAQWYERAAAQGLAVAQYRLATLYERGMGVKPDRERARHWYQQAAERGNVKAMHNLAVMIASPSAGEPDYATASQLFSRAANRGLADSQYNLGVLYESGLGVPKDHAAAYRWYALAARGGDQEAQRRRDQMIARLPAETLQAADAQIAAFRAGMPDPEANDVRAAGPGRQARSAAATR